MEATELYRCPACHAVLTANTAGGMACRRCRLAFPAVAAAIPDLTYPPALPLEVAATRRYFEALAPSYDRRLTQLLKTNEATFRRRLAERLELVGEHLILETGVGTGGNVPYLLEQHPRNRFVGLDLSPAMLLHGAARFAHYRDRVTLCVANAEYLPFAGGTFDRVLHFGFISDFQDRRRGLQEMIRVLKEGGVAVVSDDSIHPEIRQASWAQELMQNNPSFAAMPPVDELPSDVGSYDLAWFSGVFYILVLRKAGYKTQGGVDAGCTRWTTERDGRDPVIGARERFAEIPALLSIAE